MSKHFPSLANLTQKELYFDFLQIYYKRLNKYQYLDEYKSKRNFIKNYIKTNYKSLNSNHLIDKKNKLLLKVLMLNFDFGYNLFYLDYRIKKKARRLKLYKE
jgi:hypothetical protein